VGAAHDHHGPVRKDLALSDRRSLFSPYKKGNAAIGNAFGLMVMNLAGIKRGREDMASSARGALRHVHRRERGGVPWEPLHEYWAWGKFERPHSLVPNTRALGMYPEDIAAILKAISRGSGVRLRPRCTIIMSPYLAKILHAHGFTRKSLVDYLVEYARMPAAQLNVRWLKGNHHEPKGVPLPLDPTRSVRKFWSPLH